MGLNIKNPETHRLAEELAKLTGETLTAAVTTAVRERLDRVQRLSFVRAHGCGRRRPAHTLPTNRAANTPQTKLWLGISDCIGFPS
jgi:hypothetical protein